MAACNGIAFDNKTASANNTEAERAEILLEAGVQYRAAFRGQLITCAGGCERQQPLINMYRCYFCGRYYCPVCCRDHFGER